MWEVIRANKRKSWLIFALMGLLLIALGFTIGYYYAGESGGVVGAAFAVLLWLILSLISYYGGSSILLAVSGAKKVDHDVAPQLFNVVEEMKIAANLPHMPKVYIINQEAPNAFATGRDPEHSAIAVTAGLLARLNRDELQGVIAHEMSHIINRDIRLMTFAGMMLGAIVLISELFIRGLYFGGGSNRYKSKSSGGGQAQLILLVLALVFAILSPILAQLLYFALSRRREYLADASAVRLTRYPDGLANALQKLADNSYELKSANKVTAPMYIVNPLKKKGMKVSDLSSTHPPITERIRILRAISQGVNFTEYQKAYEQATGKKKNIIPESELQDAAPIAFRSKTKPPEKEERSTKRQLGDIMAKVNDFAFLACVCGLKFKVPPDYKSKQITCPRCGREHQNPLLEMAAIGTALNEAEKMKKRK